MANETKTKVLWCQETEHEYSVVHGFFTVTTKRCLKPVTPGTEQCAGHQVTLKWPE